MIGKLTTSVAALAFAMTAAEAAQVSFYQLPSGAYPHDVSPAPDGKVWYSGQQLGRAWHIRSQDRQGRACFAWIELVAAWRDHGA